MDAVADSASTGERGSAEGLACAGVLLLLLCVCV